MMRRIVLVAVLGLLVFLPAVSQAATVTYWIEYKSSWNPVYGSFYKNSEYLGGFYAGPWTAWEDGQRQVRHADLYCVDIFTAEPQGGGLHEHIGTPHSTYTYTPPGATNAGLRRAAYLYLNVGATLSRDGAQHEKHRAALQLAIWEALYDYSGQTSWTPDLATGSFRISGNLSRTGTWTDAGYTSADVKSQAITYLTDYQGEGLAVDLVNGQDMLDVPEPTTVALIGLGLLGCGLGLRRRIRK